MVRSFGRQFDELREIKCELDFLINVPNSCLIKYGNTHVICSLTIENKIPKFLQNQRQGWLTAEYNMLPNATLQRVRREISQMKVNGRNQEIQRLIGRSLRAALNLSLLGERRIVIDCDVINADGGTRTAAITGSWIILYQAIKNLMASGALTQNPLKAQIAAVACGIYKGQVITDLDYLEDSEAEADANFVLTSDNKIVEIQAAAEKNNFSNEQFLEMLNLAQKASQKLFTYQNELLNI